MRADSESTGAEPASPRGASSSHSVRRDQTSRPEPRYCRSRIGCDRSAVSTRGAQAQPARSSVSARPTAASRPGQAGSAISFSRLSAASRRAAACSGAVFGASRLSASASPVGDGAQNSAGRTKANSSSASINCGDRPGGVRPSRRAVRLA